MEIIKLLPGSVRSAVRSGIIIFDLSRVVEELVFNSLDAGATKISVLIGLGTSYIKVVDDGLGITRDGLVLLGERYVTSKFHDPADKDTPSKSLGFRGEALASISDIALLEIITKACGRPNGYRKVMKGCNCLYLGIDNDRRDVGTTVVVRDLFYNQPVRRNIMQSSPKKVFHAIKKCILHIAIAHSKVSFRVIDSESEEELLHTHPSSSPLPLLGNSFGAELSSSLQKLTVDNGSFKLSGYISGPLDNFRTKAIQYFYINSRFICKGPIHKLLNQLATGFECLDPQIADNRFQTRKRSRPQAAPAYILNLDCPTSFYDLTFDSSKTHVQFKDWSPVLTFIERAIKKIWKKNTTWEGETLSHAADVMGQDHVWEGEESIKSIEFENGRPLKSKCRLENHRASHHDIFPPLEMLNRDDDCLFPREHVNPFGYLQKNIVELKEQPVKTGCNQSRCFSQSLNCPLSKCVTSGTQKHYNHLGTLYDDRPLGEDYVSEDRFTISERCSEDVEETILNSVWEDQSLKLHFDTINTSNGSISSRYLHEINDDTHISRGVKKPLLMSCSSQGGFSLERSLLVDGEGLNNENVDLRRTRLQSIPRVITNCGISIDNNFQAKDLMKSVTSYEDQFDEENNPPSDSVALNFGSICESSNSKWYTDNSDSLLYTDWDAESYCNNGLEKCWLTGKRSLNGDLMVSKERDCTLYSDIMLKSPFKDNCTPNYMKSGLLTDDFYDTQDLGPSVEELGLCNKNSSECRDFLTSEAENFYCTPFKRDHVNLDLQSSPKDCHRNQGCKDSHVPIERSRRSHSAPPFYQRKRKIISLDLSEPESVKRDAQIFPDAQPYPEPGELKHSKHSSRMSQVYFKQDRMEATDSLLHTRPNMKKLPDIVKEMKETHEVELFGKTQALDVQDTAPDKVLSKETQDSMDLWTKWQNCCPQIARKSKSHDDDDQIQILDISSGFLCLFGDSLVPKSINRQCLEGAKVLPQVDKKFIPVVAGRTLAVIDQHAADERIRLEELRQKILSGEARTTTYLDAEQELILPEIGSQLLQNYSEQIKEWGWICNIHTQDSKSFQRNLNILHRQEAVITLLAVPCILGVNLSDVDLLEFIHQLADTDGSSTMPQSVLRVLNSKACRGAIMFGDSLLPSECSLIVEELKRTALCFQCAHGRPTAAPLVDLEVLRKEISKLPLLNDNSDESFHGLQKHGLSLERTAQRLSLARS